MKLQTHLDLQGSSGGHLTVFPAKDWCFGISTSVGHCLGVGAGGERGMGMEESKKFPKFLGFFICFFN